MTSIATGFISNNAVAAPFTPVVIDDQTNTLACSARNYRGSDFAR